MWLTSLVAAAAETTTPPANPPEIPYDQIGLVLVAVVGAISAIIIAVIQRGNKTTPAAPGGNPAPPPPSGGFTLSESEWIALRERIVRIETTVELFRSDYRQHDDSSELLHRIFHKDLDHIKRELGIT